MTVISQNRLEAFLMEKYFNEYFQILIVFLIQIYMALIILVSMYNSNLSLKQITPLDFETFHVKSTASSPPASSLQNDLYLKCCSASPHRSLPARHSFKHCTLNI